MRTTGKSRSNLTRVSGPSSCDVRPALLRFSGEHASFCLVNVNAYLQLHRWMIMSFLRKTPDTFHSATSYVSHHCFLTWVTRRSRRKKKISSFVCGRNTFCRHRLFIGRHFFDNQINSGTSICGHHFKPAQIGDQTTACSRQLFVSIEKN